MARVVGTTDNDFIARKGVSKTEVENCTIHFDQILRAD